MLTKTVFSVILKYFITLLFLILTSTISYDQFMRNIFNNSTTWAFDITLQLASLISTIGMVCVFKNNKFFTCKDLINFSNSKNKLELFTKSVHLSILFIISYYSSTFAYQSFKIKEISSNSPAKIPIYYNKIWIAIGFISMAIILILGGYNNWKYKLLTLIIASLFTVPIIIHHEKDYPTSRKIPDKYFKILEICLLFSIPIFGPIFWKNGMSIPFILYLFVAIIGYLAYGNNVFNLMVRNYWSVHNNFVLVALPQILLIGNIIKNTSIIKYVFSFLNSIFYNLPYGNTLSIMLSSVLLSGISGGTGLLDSKLNGIINPSLNPVVTPIINLSSKIGSLLGIYPIIFGSIIEQPIIKLLASSMIPLLLIILCIFSYLILFKNNLLINIPNLNGVFFSKGLIYLAVLIFSFIIIFVGLMTPTESFGTGAFLLLVYTFLTKQININQINSITYKTACFYGYIILLIASSSQFWSVISSMKVFEKINKILPNKNTYKNSFNKKIYKNTILISSLLLISLASYYFNYLYILLLGIPLIYPSIQSLGHNTSLFYVLTIVAYSIGKIGFTKSIINGYGLKATLLIIISLLIVFPKITLWLPDYL